LQQVQKRKFLKKRRMRILGARILSKCFGGKIETVQTDVNHEKKMTPQNSS